MADPGFAKGGDHGERAEPEPKRGSPAGSMGRAPGGGQGAKLPEAESFLLFFIQNMAKS